jgi:DNA (cytosine-5)-methyltransferase 1
MRIEAIDLFCGAGGLTRGLLDAGVKVVAGFDTDANCEHAYEKNNRGAKFHCRNVAGVTGAELNRLWSPGAIRMLAGCAPCQPFSTASHSKRVEGDPDPRYPLLEHFARLVRTCKPELVTMENVPSVRKYAPFLEFIQTLETLGYAIWFRSVPCVEFGVPQVRRRLVLTASRLGEAPVLSRINDSKVITVAEALAGLRKLDAGERDPRDPIHLARSLTPLNLCRIQHSKPGGTWQDWPAELRSACHTKSSGASFASVYARMRPDRPAPTMTTQFYNFGTGRFGHPTENRAITPREAAILQSFPRGYEFVAPGKAAHMAVLGRMIGNAVPPKLGEAIGKAFINHVDAAKRLGRIKAA